MHSMLVIRRFSTILTSPLHSRKRFRILKCLKQRPRQRSHSQTQSRMIGLIGLNGYVNFCSNNIIHSQCMTNNTNNSDLYTGSTGGDPSKKIKKARAKGTVRNILCCGHW